MITATLFGVLSLFLSIVVAPQAPPDPDVGAAGPALPDGLGTDPRLTWHPRLNPTATVTVDEFGQVVDWRAVPPAVVPTGGRVPLIVALEQLNNNAGEWVGVWGRQAAVKVGARTDNDETSRPAGYQGVSVVGLDRDVSTSTGAVIGGFQLAQYVGVQRDFAFLNLTVDSWTNRPCTTAAHANPTFGHLYVERVDLLGIPNDLARQDAAGAWKTAKGDAATTWWFRLEGHVQSHFLEVHSVGGVVPGDGLDGTSEHGVYQNGPPGDSEFVDVRFHGSQISALYFVTRYADRIMDSTTGDPIAERYGQGRLLLEDVFAWDCGVNGSFAVNVCGGPQLRVRLRNFHYRVNRDGYDLSGHTPGGKWAGGAVQFYCDHKAFELVPPINSQSKPVALGYSLESGRLDVNGDPLPMSVGVQDLVDAGTIPWDGFGASRELLIEGGLFEVANVTPPLIKLRDVGLVSIAPAVADVTPWTVTGIGAGKVLSFGDSGLGSQCGPAHNPARPAGLLPGTMAAAGWNQQARFLTRRPSTWLGGAVAVNGTKVAPAMLDTWSWRP